MFCNRHSIRCIVILDIAIKKKIRCPAFNKKYLLMNRIFFFHTNQTVLDVICNFAFNLIVILFFFDISTFVVAFTKFQVAEKL